MDFGGTKKIQTPLGGTKKMSPLFREKASALLYLIGVGQKNSNPAVGGWTKFGPLLWGDGKNVGVLTWKFTNPPCC